MPTLKEESADLLRRMYHLHEFEPGFQMTDATSYGAKADACLFICKAARSLLYMAESRCNGVPRYDIKARRMLASWTEDDEARAERSDERAEARIRDALATIYGDNWRERIDFETQGDPRGAMVKLWAAGTRNQGSPRLSL